MSDQAEKPEQATQSASEQGAKVQPSGPKGDSPGTAGLGEIKVRSNTPENRLGHLNPSAAEDANTTPGSVGEK